MAGPGSVYGYEVESDFPLRRLLPVPGPRGRIELRRSEAPLREGEGIPVHAYTDGATSFTLTRLGDRLHVDCSASGEFLVDGPVLLAAPTDCPPDLWEHRVVTTAIPLVLAELGELLLHGAAIDVDGRAVVLAGTTGRGKSTAARAAAGLGLPLLGEDGIAFELSGPEALVWPGPLGVRLAGEAGGAKRTEFLPERAHGRAPLPAAAVVVLGERGAALTLERLEPAAAVPFVLPHLIYGGSDRLPAAFGHCAALVSRVAVFRGSLPGGLELLPGALAELLGRVSGAAAPARG